MCASPASKSVTKLRPSFLLVAWLCLFSAAGAAAETDNARHWLDRLSKAVRERNYEGTFVYLHQGNIETLRIIHRADDDGEMERLYSLTGEPREIIRDNERVTCILPDDKAVMVDRRQLGNPLSNVVPGNTSRLDRSYRLELLGDDRIANREAKQVGITPQDRYRYGYRLWIDQESGLLLRADLVNEQGEPVEQLLFTELRMPEVIPTSALEPRISGEGFTWFQEPVDAKAESPANLQWQVPGIPEGFDLVLHEVRPLPGSDRPVEHLLYSDGLASVSIYIESAGEEAGFSGHSRMGALNAYGLELDGYQATVVGEVPAATVSRVGKSIRRNTAATGSPNK